MDESIVKQLVLKPSQAIRLGAQLAHEIRYAYLMYAPDGRPCGCALGLMAAGYGAVGNIYHIDDIAAYLKPRSGLSHRNLRQINRDHYFNGKTAAQIAYELEAAGK